MARFSIVTKMLTIPKSAAVGEADTPADAVRIARQHAQQGKNVQIGDNDSQMVMPIDQFAAKHGIR